MICLFTCSVEYKKHNVLKIISTKNEFTKRLGVSTFICSCDLFKRVATALYDARDSLRSNLTRNYNNYKLNYIDIDRQCVFPIYMGYFINCWLPE